MDMNFGPLVLLEEVLVGTKEVLDKLASKDKDRDGDSLEKFTAENRKVFEEMRKFLGDVSKKGKYQNSAKMEHLLAKLENQLQDGGGKLSPDSSVFEKIKSMASNMEVKPGSEDSKKVDALIKLVEQTQSAVKTSEDGKITARSIQQFEKVVKSLEDRLKPIEKIGTILSKAGSSDKHVGEVVREELKSAGFYRQGQSVASGTEEIHKDTVAKPMSDLNQLQSLLVQLIAVTGVNGERLQRVIAESFTKLSSIGAPEYSKLGSQVDEALGKYADFLKSKGALNTDAGVAGLESLKKEKQSNRKPADFDRYAGDTSRGREAVKQTFSLRDAQLNNYREMQNQGAGHSMTQKTIEEAYSKKTELTKEKFEKQELLKSDNLTDKVRKVYFTRIDKINKAISELELDVKKALDTSAMYKSPDLSLSKSFNNFTKATPAYIENIVSDKQRDTSSYQEYEKSAKDNLEKLKKEMQSRIEKSAQVNPSNPLTPEKMPQLSAKINAQEKVVAKATEKRKDIESKASVASEGIPFAMQGSVSSNKAVIEGKLSEISKGLSEKVQVHIAEMVDALGTVTTHITFNKADISSAVGNVEKTMFKGVDTATKFVIDKTAEIGKIFTESVSHIQSTVKEGLSTVQMDPRKNKNAIFGETLSKVFSDKIARGMISSNKTPETESNYAKVLVESSKDVRVDPTLDLFNRYQTEESAHKGETESLLKMQQGNPYKELYQDYAKEAKGSKNGVVDFKRKGGVDNAALKILAKLKGMSKEISDKGTENPEYFADTQEFIQDVTAEIEGMKQHLSDKKIDVSTGDLKDKNFKSVSSLLVRLSEFSDVLDAYLRNRSRGTVGSYEPVKEGSLSQIESLLTNTGLYGTHTRELPDQQDQVQVREQSPYQGSKDVYERFSNLYIAFSRRLDNLKGSSTSGTTGKEESLLTERISEAKSLKESLDAATVKLDQLKSSNAPVKEISSAKEAVSVVEKNIGEFVKKVVGVSGSRGKDSSTSVSRKWDETKQSVDGALINAFSEDRLRGIAEKLTPEQRLNAAIDQGQLSSADVQQSIDAIWNEYVTMPAKAYSDVSKVEGGKMPAFDLKKREQEALARIKKYIISVTKDLELVQRTKEDPDKTTYITKSGMSSDEIRNETGEPGSMKSSDPQLDELKSIGGFHASEGSRDRSAKDNDYERTINNMLDVFKGVSIDKLKYKHRMDKEGNLRSEPLTVQPTSIEETVKAFKSMGTSIGEFDESGDLVKNGRKLEVSKSEADAIRRLSDQMAVYFQKKVEVKGTSGKMEYKDSEFLGSERGIYSPTQEFFDELKKFKAKQILGKDYNDLTEKERTSLESPENKAAYEGFTVAELERLPEDLSKIMYGKDYKGLSSPEKGSVDERLKKVKGASRQNSPKYQEFIRTLMVRVQSDAQLKGNSASTRDFTEVADKVAAIDESILKNIGDRVVSAFSSKEGPDKELAAIISDIDSNVAVLDNVANLAKVESGVRPGTASTILSKRTKAVDNLAKLKVAIGQLKSAPAAERFDLVSMIDKLSARVSKDLEGIVIGIDQAAANYDESAAYSKRAYSAMSKIETASQIGQNSKPKKNKSALDTLKGNAVSVLTEINEKGMSFLDARSALSLAIDKADESQLLLLTDLTKAKDVFRGGNLDTAKLYTKTSQGRVVSTGFDERTRNQAKSGLSQVNSKIQDITESEITAKTEKGDRSHLSSDKSVLARVSGSMLIGDNRPEEIQKIMAGITASKEQGLDRNLEAFSSKLVFGDIKPSDLDTNTSGGQERVDALVKRLRDKLVSSIESFGETVDVKTREAIEASIHREIQWTREVLKKQEEQMLQSNIESGKTAPGTKIDPDKFSVAAALKYRFKNTAKEVGNYVNGSELAQKSIVYGDPETGRNLVDSKLATKIYDTDVVSQGTVSGANMEDAYAEGIRNMVATQGYGTKDSGLTPSGVQSIATRGMFGKSSLFGAVMGRDFSGKESESAAIGKNVHKSLENLSHIDFAKEIEAGYVAVEQKLDRSSDGASLGTVDEARAVKDGDGYRVKVRDYKTSTLSPTEVAEKSATQQALYQRSIPESDWGKSLGKITGIDTDIVHIPRKEFVKGLNTEGLLGENNKGTELELSAQLESRMTAIREASSKGTMSAADNTFLTSLRELVNRVATIVKVDKPIAEAEREVQLAGTSMSIVKDLGFQEHMNKPEVKSRFEAEVASSKNGDSSVKGKFLDEFLASKGLEFGDTFDAKTAYSKMSSFKGRSISDDELLEKSAAMESEKAKVINQATEDKKYATGSEEAKGFGECCDKLVKAITESGSMLKRTLEQIDQDVCDIKTRLSKASSGVPTLNAAAAETASGVKTPGKKVTGESYESLLSEIGDADKLSKYLKREARRANDSSKNIIERSSSSSALSNYLEPKEGAEAGTTLKGRLETIQALKQKIAGDGALDMGTELKIKDIERSLKELIESSDKAKESLQNMATTKKNSLWKDQASEVRLYARELSYLAATNKKIIGIAVESATTDKSKKEAISSVKRGISEYREELDKLRNIQGADKTFGVAAIKSAELELEKLEKMLIKISGMDATPKGLRTFEQLFAEVGKHASSVSQIAKTTRDANVPLEERLQSLKELAMVQKEYVTSLTAMGKVAKTPEQQSQAFNAFAKYDGLKASIASSKNAFEYDSAINSGDPTRIREIETSRVKEQMQDFNKRAKTTAAVAIDLKGQGFDVLSKEIIQTEKILDIRGREIGLLKMVIDSQGRVTTSIEESTNALRGGLAKQLETVMGRIAKFGAGSYLFYGIQAQARQAVGAMLSVEEQVNTLRQVMSEASTDFGKIKNDLYGIAQEMARPIDDVMGTAIEFSRQGLGQAEVTSLTKTTAVAANVTDMTQVEAMDNLTAATRQYSFSLKESMAILDSWNNVANKNAVTAKDLGEAVKQVGALAKISGLEFNRLNGMVAAMQEVTRKGGSTIGRVMKQMLTNMRTDKAEESLNSVGISIRKTAQEYRDAQDVFNDLAGSWNNITDAQKQQIALSLGQVRYGSFVTAMFENWDIVTKATTDSLYSNGSAMAENQIAMESTKRTLESLKNTWGEVVQVSGQLTLPVLDGGAKAIRGILSTVNELPGGVRTVVVGLGTVVTTTAVAATALKLLTGGQLDAFSLIGGLLKKNTIDSKKLAAEFAALKNVSVAGIDKEAVALGQTKVLQEGLNLSVKSEVGERAAVNSLLQQEIALMKIRESMSTGKGKISKKTSQLGDAATDVLAREAAAKATKETLSKKTKDVVKDTGRDIAVKGGLFAGLRGLFAGGAAGGGGAAAAGTLAIPPVAIAAAVAAAIAGIGVGAGAIKANTDVKGSKAMAGRRKDIEKDRYSLSENQGALEAYVSAASKVSNASNLNEKALDRELKLRKDLAGIMPGVVAGYTTYGVAVLKSASSLDVFAKTLRDIEEAREVDYIISLANAIDDVFTAMNRKGSGKWYEGISSLFGASLGTSRIEDLQKATTNKSQAEAALSVAKESGNEKLISKKSKEVKKATEEYVSSQAYINDAIEQMDSLFTKAGERGSGQVVNLLSTILEKSDTAGAFTINMTRQLEAFGTDYEKGLKVMISKMVGGDLANYIRNADVSQPVSEMTALSSRLAESVIKAPGADKALRERANQLAESLASGSVSVSTDLNGMYAGIAENVKLDADKAAKITENTLAVFTKRVKQANGEYKEVQSYLLNTDNKISVIDLSPKESLLTDGKLDQKKVDKYASEEMVKQYSSVNEAYTAAKGDGGELKQVQSIGAGPSVSYTDTLGIAQKSVKAFTETFEVLDKAIDKSVNKLSKMSSVSKEFLNFGDVELSDYNRYLEDMSKHIGSIVANYGDLFGAAVKIDAAMSSVVKEQSGQVAIVRKKSVVDQLSYSSEKGLLDEPGKKLFKTASVASTGKTTEDLGVYGKGYVDSVRASLEDVGSKISGEIDGIDLMEYATDFIQNNTDLPGKLLKKINETIKPGSVSSSKVSSVVDKTIEDAFSVEGMKEYLAKVTADYESLVNQSRKDIEDATAGLKKANNTQNAGKQAGKYFGKMVDEGKGTDIESVKAEVKFEYGISDKKGGEALAKEIHERYTHVMKAKEEVAKIKSLAEGMEKDASSAKGVFKKALTSISANETVGSFSTDTSVVRATSNEKTFAKLLVSIKNINTEANAIMNSGADLAMISRQNSLGEMLGLTQQSMGAVIAINNARGIGVDAAKAIYKGMISEQGGDKAKKSFGTVLASIEQEFKKSGGRSSEGMQKAIKEGLKKAGMGGTKEAEGFLEIFKAVGVDPRNLQVMSETMATMSKSMKEMGDDADGALGAAGSDAQQKSIEEQAKAMEQYLKITDLISKKKEEFKTAVREMATAFQGMGKVSAEGVGENFTKLSAAVGRSGGNIKETIDVMKKSGDPELVNYGKYLQEELTSMYVKAFGSIDLSVVKKSVDSIQKALAVDIFDNTFTSGKEALTQIRQLGQTLAELGVQYSEVTTFSKIFDEASKSAGNAEQMKEYKEKVQKNLDFIIGQFESLGMSIDKNSVKFESMTTSMLKNMYIVGDVANSLKQSVMDVGAAFSNINTVTSAIKGGGIQNYNDDKGRIDAAEKYVSTIKERILLLEKMKSVQQGNLQRETDPKKKEDISSEIKRMEESAQILGEELGKSNFELEKMRQRSSKLTLGRSLSEASALGKVYEGMGGAFDETGAKISAITSRVKDLNDEIGKFSENPELKFELKLEARQLFELKNVREMQGALDAVYESYRKIDSADHDRISQRISYVGTDAKKFSSGPSFAGGSIDQRSDALDKWKTVISTAKKQSMAGSEYVNPKLVSDMTAQYAKDSSSLGIDQLTDKLTTLEEVGRKIGNSKLFNNYEKMSSEFATELSRVQSILEDPNLQGSNWEESSAMLTTYISGLEKVKAISDALSAGKKYDADIKAITELSAALSGMGASGIVDSYYAAEDALVSFENVLKSVLSTVDIKSKEGREFLSQMFDVSIEANSMRIGKSINQTIDQLKKYSAIRKLYSAKGLSNTSLDMEESVVSEVSTAVDTLRDSYYKLTKQKEMFEKVAETDKSGDVSKKLVEISEKAKEAGDMLGKFETIWTKVQTTVGEVSAFKELQKSLNKTFAEVQVFGDSMNTAGDAADIYKDTIVSLIDVFTQGGKLSWDKVDDSAKSAIGGVQQYYSLMLDVQKANERMYSTVDSTVNRFNDFINSDLTDAESVITGITDMFASINSDARSNLMNDVGENLKKAFSKKVPIDEIRVSADASIKELLNSVDLLSVDLTNLLPALKEISAVSGVSLKDIVDKQKSALIEKIAATPDSISKDQMKSTLEQWEKILPNVSGPGGAGGSLGEDTFFQDLKIGFTDLIQGLANEFGVQLKGKKHAQGAVYMATGGGVVNGYYGSDMRNHEAYVAGEIPAVLHPGEVVIPARYAGSPGVQQIASRLPKYGSDGRRVSAASGSVISAAGGSASYMKSMVESIEVEVNSGEMAKLDETTKKEIEVSKELSIGLEKFSKELSRLRKDQDKSFFKFTEIMDSVKVMGSSDPVVEVTPGPVSVPVSTKSLNLSYIPETKQSNEFMLPEKREVRKESALDMVKTGNITTAVYKAGNVLSSKLAEMKIIASGFGKYVSKNVKANISEYKAKREVTAATKKSNKIAEEQNLKNFDVKSYVNKGGFGTSYSLIRGMKKYESSQELEQSKKFYEKRALNLRPEREKLQEGRSKAFKTGDFDTFFSKSKEINKNLAESAVAFGKETKFKLQSMRSDTSRFRQDVRSVLKGMDKEAVEAMRDSWSERLKKSKAMGAQGASKEDKKMYRAEQSEVRKNLFFKEMDEKRKIAGTAVKEQGGNMGLAFLSGMSGNSELYEYARGKASDDNKKESFEKVESKSLEEQKEKEGAKVDIKALAGAVQSGSSSSKSTAATSASSSKGAMSGDKGAAAADIFSMLGAATDKFEEQIREKIWDGILGTRSNYAEMKEKGLDKYVAKGEGDREDLQEEMAKNRKLGRETGETVGGAIGSIWGPLGKAIGTQMGQAIGVQVSSILTRAFNKETKQERKFREAQNQTKALTLQLESARMIESAASLLYKSVDDLLGGMSDIMSAVASDLGAFANNTAWVQMRDMFETDNGLSVSGGQLVADTATIKSNMGFNDFKAKQSSLYSSEDWSSFATFDEGMKEGAWWDEEAEKRKGTAIGNSKDISAKLGLDENLSEAEAMLYASMQEARYSVEQVSESFDTLSERVQGKIDKIAEIWTAAGGDVKEFGKGLSKAALATMEFIQVFRATQDGGREFDFQGAMDRMFLKTGSRTMQVDQLNTDKSRIASEKTALENEASAAYKTNDELKEEAKKGLLWTTADEERYQTAILLQTQQQSEYATKIKEKAEALKAIDDQIAALSTANVGDVQKFVDDMQKITGAVNKMMDGATDTKRAWDLIGSALDSAKAKNAGFYESLKGAASGLGMVGDWVSKLRKNTSGGFDFSTSGNKKFKDMSSGSSSFVSDIQSGNFMNQTDLTNYLLSNNIAKSSVTGSNTALSQSQLQQIASLDKGVADQVGNMGVIELTRALANYRVSSANETSDVYKFQTDSFVSVIATGMDNFVYTAEVKFSSIENMFNEWTSKNKLKIEGINKAFDEFRSFAENIDGSAFAGSVSGMGAGNVLDAYNAMPKQMTQIFSETARGNLELTDEIKTFYGEQIQLAAAQADALSIASAAQSVSRVGVVGRISTGLSGTSMTATQITTALTPLNAAITAGVSLSPNELDGLIGVITDQLGNSTEGLALTAELISVNNDVMSINSRAADQQAEVVSLTKEANDLLRKQYELYKSEHGKATDEKSFIQANLDALRNLQQSFNRDTGGVYTTDKGEVDRISEAEDLYLRSVGNGQFEIAKTLQEFSEMYGQKVVSGPKDISTWSQVRPVTNNFTIQIDADFIDPSQLDADRQRSLAMVIRGALEDENLRYSE